MWGTGKVVTIDLLSHNASSADADISKPSYTQLSKKSWVYLHHKIQKICTRKKNVLSSVKLFMNVILIVLFKGDVMSLLKKILSPIIRIVHSSLRFWKNEEKPHDPHQKQGTTHYSCMLELHAYNKRKAILQNRKIEQ